MATPTKTIQVRIELPEDLHAKLAQEAEEDERTLSVYIVRVLRGLKPKPPTRQSAFTAPIPSGQFPGPVSTLTLEPSTADNPLAEPLPPPPSPNDDLPIEQWDNNRLVRTLQEKRTAAQEERARIASMQAGPAAEQAKAALEHLLKFVAVLEAEFMKRRGKQPKKAPQPPRENPHRA